MMFSCSLSTKNYQHYKFYYEFVIVNHLAKVLRHISREFRAWGMRKDKYYQTLNCVMRLTPKFKSWKLKNSKKIGSHPWMCTEVENQSFEVPNSQKHKVFEG